MDQRLLDLLDVESCTPGIIDMEIRKAGLEVALTFMLNAPDRAKLFQLTFSDCDEIKLSTWYKDESVEADGELEADVLGLVTGADAYTQPAIISCDVFDMWLSYGTLSVEKNW